MIFHPCQQHEDDQLWYIVTGWIVGVKFSLLVGVYSFTLHLISDAKHLYMADLHSDVLQNVCLKIFAHLNNWVISYY